MASREDLVVLGKHVDWVVDWMGREISTGQGPAGVPRDQVTVPIARGQAFTDDTFYDAPAGGDVYFVPRWRVGQPPGGLPQIVLQQGSPAWTLTVHLAGFASPAIADQLGAAQPIPCDYSCLVRYNLAPSAGAPGTGSVVREVFASDVTGAGLELTATFTGTEAAGLNQLYSAMTEDEHGTVLVVRRTVTAAIELPPSTGGGGAGPTFPDLPIIRWPIDPIVVKPRPIDDDEPDPDGPLPIVVGQPIEIDLGTSLIEPPIVDIDQLGPILRANRRTSVGGFDADHGLDAADDLGDGVVGAAPALDESAILLHPGGSIGNSLVTSGKLIDDLIIRDPILWPIDDGTPVGPRYDQRTAELDDIQPFVYPLELYPSIYAGVTAGTASFALRRFEVLFEGRSYPYYQDVGAAATFYYLPDAFRLGRKVPAPLDASAGGAADPPTPREPP